MKPGTSTTVEDDATASSIMNSMDMSDLSPFDVWAVAVVAARDWAITWHGDKTVRRWCTVTGALKAVQTAPGDAHGSFTPTVLDLGGVGGSAGPVLIVRACIVNTVPCLLSMRAEDLSVVLCVPLLPGFEYEPDVEFQSVLWDSRDGLRAVVGLQLTAADEDDIPGMQVGAVDASADSAHPPAQTKLWGPVVRPSHAQLAVHAEDPPRLLLHVHIPAALVMAAAAVPAVPSAQRSLHAAGAGAGAGHAPSAGIHGDLVWSRQAAASGQPGADPGMGASSRSSEDSVEEPCVYADFGLSAHITHRTLLSHATVSADDIVPVQHGRLLVGCTAAGVFALAAVDGSVDWTWTAAEDPKAVQLLGRTLDDTESEPNSNPESHLQIHVETVFGSTAGRNVFLRCALSRGAEDGRTAQAAQSTYALLGLCLTSREVTGVFPLLTRNAVIHVAAPNGATVVIAHAGVGLILLHPDTLQPMHEHPYQFNGTPKHLQFVFDAESNKGTGPAESQALPSRIIVFGSDAQLMEMPVRPFLGPLHLSPQIDLVQLLNIPEGIWRQWDIAMFYVGLVLAVVLLLVDFAQMASFAFSTASPPSLQGSAQTVQQFQALGLIGVQVSFQLVFWTTVSVLALFVALMASSEAIEDYVFRHREDYNVQLVWSGVSIVVQLMTSVAVIPFTRVLVGAFDCIPSADGEPMAWHAVAPDTVLCFGTGHLPYAIVAAGMLVVYFPLVLRLLLVRNDLSRVELHLSAPWDWSGDDRSAPPRLHVLSQTASVFGVAQAVAKLLASVVYVLLGARFPEWSAVAVLCLGVAVLLAGLQSPPYHYVVMNRVRTALDAGVLWTYTVAVVAVFVLRSTSPQAGDTTDVALSVLPAGILVVVPLVFWVQHQHRASQHAASQPPAGSSTAESVTALSKVPQVTASTCSSGPMLQASLKGQTALHTLNCRQQSLNCRCKCCTCKPPCRYPGRCREWWGSPTGVGAAGRRAGNGRARRGGCCCHCETGGQRKRRVDGLAAGGWCRGRTLCPGRRLLGRGRRGGGG